MSSRILVIEDNDDIALVVKTTLRLRDYDVETTGNGLTGLEAVRRDPPDLVILDVLLPELDGYQVLKAIKSDPATAGIPVALFSAHLSDREQHDAMAAGAAAVLIKPFEPRQFISEVEALLARHG